MAEKRSDKQELFCIEYIKDFNGTKAAIRAEYSEKSAASIAAELLRKPHIQERIIELKAERIRKTKVDAAWLLTRLHDEAEADIADIYNEDMTLKPIHEWPKIWRQGLVQGVDVAEIWDGYGEEKQIIGQLKKVRLSNRMDRLNAIGKHIDVQAFQENVNHTGIEGLGDRLARALKNTEGE